MRLNGAAAAAGGSAARRRLFVTILWRELTPFCEGVLSCQDVLLLLLLHHMKRPVCSIQERHGRFKGKVIAWVKKAYSQPIRGLMSSKGDNLVLIRTLTMTTYQSVRTGFRSKYTVFYVHFGR